MQREGVAINVWGGGSEGNASERPVSEAGGFEWSVGGASIGKKS